MNHSRSLPTSSEYETQQAQGYTDQAMRQMEHVVEERPFSSVMVSFGIGMGIGLAIGTTLVAAMQEPPKTRMAERMGQQFMDALNRAVPDSLSSRFSS